MEAAKEAEAAFQSSASKILNVGKVKSTSLMGRWVFIVQGVVSVGGVALFSTSGQQATIGIPCAQELLVGGLPNRG